MIGAAIIKDVRLLVRDRGTLISLFLLPVVFIVVFGFMFGGAGDRRERPREIPIWHAPDDARGLAVVAALTPEVGFKPVLVATADEVRARVASDRAPAGLIVPADPAAAVELSIDLGAQPQVRAPLQGALTAVVLRALAPPLPPGVELPRIDARTPPGLPPPVPRLSAFQLTVPGNAVLFGFYIALTVAMAFAVERRTGTWRRLLASPVPRWRALLSTLVPYYLVGITQLAFLFGLGAGAFGMEVAGSLAALIALSLALTLCAVSLGLLMGAIGGSERQLGAIGSVVLLVMGMLGGCMFPRALMPPVMKSLGLAVPHGWALDGYYEVLVRQGTTLADVAPQLAVITAFAVGFALLGLARFRFER